MLPSRFWKKVLNVAETDSCWEWIGAKCQGYGQFRFNGKVCKAHRLMIEENEGLDIPENHVVMHLCDNRACVNPHHLAIGTVQENNLDRDKKGRQVAKKGEDHGMSKLFVSGIQKIRELQSKQEKERAELAKELSVSSVTIKDVMDRKTWNWLE